MKISMHCKPSLPVVECPRYENPPLAGSQLVAGSRHAGTHCECEVPAQSRRPSLASSRHSTASTLSMPARPLKIIFLDVDGVLHEAHHAREPFRPECMKVLAAIVEETKAEIVLSSTWRLNKNQLAGVEQALKRHKLPKLFGVIGSDEAGSRGAQILCWIKNNTAASPGAGVRWIAVDDQDLTLDIEQEHMVLTHPKHGLRKRDLKRAVAILNETEIAECEFDFDSDSSQSVGSWLDDRSDEMDEEALSSMSSSDILSKFSS